MEWTGQTLWHAQFCLWGERQLSQQLLSETIATLFLIVETGPGYSLYTLPSHRIVSVNEEGGAYVNI